jgi:hypothetical protein
LCKPEDARVLVERLRKERTWRSTSRGFRQRRRRAEVTRHFTTRNDKSEPERRPRYREKTCALQDRSVSVNEPEVTGESKAKRHRPKPHYKATEPTLKKKGEGQRSADEARQRQSEGSCRSTHGRRTRIVAVMNYRTSVIDHETPVESMICSVALPLTT